MSTSNPTPALADVVDPEFVVEQVIDKFLEAFDTPSDEQVHMLAQSMNMTVPQLEEIVFRMFGSDVDQAVEEDPEIQLYDGETLSDVQDLEPQDPIDDFVLAFFLYCPQPTEAQVHMLAAVVGESPQQFEERVYRMMAELQDEATVADYPSVEEVEKEIDPEDIYL
jgi:hypothetical protein